METTPFTERSNVITENIDISSPAEMVELLRRTDEEIFTGSAAKDQNIYDDNLVKRMTNLAVLIRRTIQVNKPEDVAIVLSGCGTSGRLAYMLSKVCNVLAATVLGTTPFHYSIAGGDKSILTSQEAPEDDPQAGTLSLLKICSNRKKVIYIGITCGISAPFVGGQLDHCMKHLDVFTPVLLGFNPIHMARNVAIAGWHKTVRDVAVEMEAKCEEGKAFVINPILGAEAITGSSRMKGGTATKVILEAVLLSALNSLEINKEEILTAQNMASILKLYERVCRDFYDSNAKDVMKSLIERSGDALKQAATVRYLASGWTGVIPLIDSTECPPTFGSSVNDVRGFVDGGYDFLGIEDFGKENGNFKLSFKNFVELYSNNSAENDAIIGFIQSNSDPILTSLKQDLRTALQKIRGRNRTIGVVLQRTNSTPISVAEIQDCFDEVVIVELPQCTLEEVKDWGDASRHALRDSLFGCCLKWMVNATSTGGHVLLGKVYKNYMCDVKVSNSKLFYRSIEIIKKLCPEVPHDVAHDSLLRSIYEVDEVTDSTRNKPVEEHYKAAGPKDKVVPLAIILAKLNCSIKTAKETLERHSVIRNAVLEVTTN